MSYSPLKGHSYTSHTIFFNSQNYSESVYNSITFHELLVVVIGFRKIEEDAKKQQQQKERKHGTYDNWNPL